MKEFCVLFLSGEQAQVCVFRKNAGRFRLKECATLPLNQTDPAETCRKLLHQTGYSKDTSLIVSCAMKDGVFFRCTSVRLASDAMRNALEFELPRRLLHEPDDCIIQFLPLDSDTEEGVPVNVYAFPGSSMPRLAAVITQSIRKADFYLYPLIALQEKDGISLTIEKVYADRFKIGIIPTTWEETALRTKKKGSLVNLETDVIGKYVIAHLMKSQEKGRGSVTMETLAEAGFL